jgi:hypothetical protein
MRVFELAEDLKVQTKDLLALLRAMGVAVAGKDTEVDDADAARVLARVERERRSKKKDAAGAVQAAIEESSAPARRRRRRSAEEDAAEAPEPETAPSPRATAPVFSRPSAATAAIRPPPRASPTTPITT